MKRQIIIFEHDFYRYYTAKLVLEGILRLSVKSIAVEGNSELDKNLLRLRSGAVVLSPDEGVTELVDDLRSRGATRLNSEVTFILIHDWVKPNLGENLGKVSKCRRNHRQSQPKVA